VKSADELEKIIVTAFINKTLGAMPRVLVGIADQPTRRKIARIAVPSPSPCLTEGMTPLSKKLNASVIKTIVMRVVTIKAFIGTCWSAALTE